MQCFMQLYCEKLGYLWPATGTGGLIDCQGTEDVKRVGVENLAGVSTPPTPPHQLAACLYCVHVYKPIKSDYVWLQEPLDDENEAIHKAKAPASG